MGWEEWEETDKNMAVEQVNGDMHLALEMELSGLVDW